MEVIKMVLQLHKIDLNSIGLLQIIENYSKRLQSPLPVVAVDVNDRICLGDLEQTLFRSEKEEIVRDLIVYARFIEDGRASGVYLFDDDVKDLYVIGVDIYQFKI